ncbi:TonB-dependent receptor plug domain-containing protein [Faucicola atlantae]|nr:TonB-dependent receptor [Moraxella atlantae]
MAASQLTIEQSRVMFKLTAMSLSILASFGMNAYADEVGQTANLVALAPLTFTASRTPTQLTHTIAQTQVVDVQDLQRFRGQSVLEVLRHQPGIVVRQNGGEGTVSSISLRGFGNAGTLVLIDGIRYGSASTGGAALSLLPADQIDRIEVVYGASASSLYGADAMGGVIQIFTKGQNARQTGASAAIGAGSQSTYQANAVGQYVTGDTTLSLGAGYHKTDGIDATNADNFAPYHDKDGFTTKNVSVVGKRVLNPAWQVGASLLYADSTTDYDSSGYDADFNPVPFVDSHSDQKNGAWQAHADYQQDALSAQLRYGQSIDKSTSYDGITPNGGTFDTKQQQANLQLGYNLATAQRGVGQVIGGAEWLKQSLSGNGVKNYQKTDRDVTSGFVGYQLNQDQYDLQAHVRYDDNSQYGDKTTYNLGAAYRIAPDWRIGAAYATGFRAPTFNDLYYPGSENPDLKPETSKNTELFAEYRTANSSSRLTAYHSRWRDKLKWVTTDFKTYAGQMQNVDKVDIDGIGLTHDWQRDAWAWGLSYTYQKVEDQTTDKQLDYEPKSQGLVYVGYQTPQYALRGEIEYVDSRTAGNGAKKLDSYTLLNVSGKYNISPVLSIGARLNNLTDKDYSTAYGYNAKGINGLVDVTYKFK